MALELLFLLLKNSRKVKNFDSLNKNVANLLCTTCLLPNCVILDILKVLKSVIFEHCKSVSSKIATF